MPNKERYRRLVKEGFWIVLGQVLTVLGALAGVRLLTELLSPHAYGELALGMTIAILVNQIFLGPLAGGVTRFYAPAAEHGELTAYWLSAKKLLVLTTVMIVLLGMVAVTIMLATGNQQWVPITVSALVFAIFSGYCVNISGIQSAARQRSIVAFHQGADTTLRALMAAAMILWLGATSTYAMLGYALSASIVFLSQIIFLRKVISRPANEHSASHDWTAKLWRYSWPLGAYGIFTWMQLSSDRWALQLFASTQDVGNYAVLYQLGYYPIALLTGMANQFLEPILYKRAGDASDSSRIAGVNQLSWQLVWMNLGVTGVAFIIAMLFHVQIFGILVAEEYRSISYLLPWLILSGGVFSSGQSLASLLLAQLKTRELMSVKIMTALLGVVLNLAGGYFLGIIGIIFANILFSLSYFIGMSLLIVNVNKKT